MGSFEIPRYVGREPQDLDSRQAGREGSDASGEAAPGAGCGFDGSAQAEPGANAGQEAGAEGQGSRGGRARKGGGWRIGHGSQATAGAKEESRVGSAPLNRSSAGPLLARGSPGHLE